MYNLLDDYFPSLCPPSYRCLKSTIPSRVEAYLKSLEDNWGTHNITTKIDQVEEYFKTTGVTEHNTSCLNRLDNQIQDILTNAGKQYCNVGKDVTNLFSVPLAKLLKNECYKRCEINKYFLSMTLKYGSTTIRKLLHERKGLRDARVNDVQLREKDLADKAELAHKKNPKHPAVKYIVSLKHTKKQIRQANHIRKKFRRLSPWFIQLRLNPFFIKLL